MRAMHQPSMSVIQKNSYQSHAQYNSGGLGIPSISPTFNQMKNEDDFIATVNIKAEAIA